MGDIAYWDDELSSKLRAIEKDVAAAREAPDAEKRKLVAVCETKLKNAATTQRQFNMELRLLDADNIKLPYQAKLQSYDAQLKQLRTEVEWVKADIGKDKAREDLFGDRAEQGKMTFDPTVSRDELLAQSHTTQDKTEAALKRTLQTMNDTNQVADATLEALTAQTQQIKKIDEDLTNVASEMDRAKDVMKSFVRRAMTDRLILIFLVLIIVAVIVLVIFLAINKDIP
mmetsp:Transcript_18785/g.33330  ORF Transcript_18785/g.33330 Transcript_18785/m.33330 type:complete len:228 (+) Transcript_18785:201-884(+)